MWLRLKRDCSTYDIKLVLLARCLKTQKKSDRLLRLFTPQIRYYMYLTGKRRSNTESREPHNTDTALTVEI